MAFSPRLAILWISTLVLEVSVASEHCVMYGMCGENYFGSEATCIYNGTAKPLDDDEGRGILHKICPELSAESNLCCSADQLINLKNNMKIIETSGFGRCPSCIVNFRKNFCEFVCSPKQNTFLEIIEIGEGEDGDEIVESVNYHMSYSYAEGMFASCKDVRSLTPGSTVLDLICGAWGRNCTPERWLNFMGATPDDGGFSPFKINYLLTSEETIVGENDEVFHPMQEKTTTCSESPAPGFEACACIDCEAACQVNTTEPPSLTEEITEPPSLTEEITQPPSLTEEITEPPSLTEEITEPPPLTQETTPPSTFLKCNHAMAVASQIVFCVFTAILVTVL